MTSTDQTDPGVFQFAALELGSAAFAPQRPEVISPRDVVAFARGRDLGTRQDLVLKAIEHKLWAGILFARARKAYAVGYSGFAKAAATTKQGVRRQLGGCTLNVVKEGPGWFIVLRLEAALETPPTKLLVGEPPELMVLSLNRPIGAYIQQPVQADDANHTDRLLESLLAPNTIVSLQ